MACRHGIDCGASLAGNRSSDECAPGPIARSAWRGRSSNSCGHAPRRGRMETSKSCAGGTRKSRYGSGDWRGGDIRKNGAALVRITRRRGGYDFDLIASLSRRRALFRIHQRLDNNYALLHSNYPILVAARRLTSGISVERVASVAGQRAGLCKPAQRGKSQTRSSRRVDKERPGAIHMIGGSGEKDV